MAKIKNIIFDFGGVLYDVRYENIAEAFESHGITNIGEFYTRTFQTPEIDRFEMGLMSPAEFHDYVRKASGHPASDAVIDEIMNAILIDMPAQRVELLLKLRAKYKVILFSNTNQIHYDCFYDHLLKKFNFDIFPTCFDACYFYHTMHMRKPNTDGFRRILKEQGLVPNETLFIDDNAPNLEGAREVGIHGYHLCDKDVCDLFDEDLNFIQEVKNSCRRKLYKKQSFSSTRQWTRK